MLKGTLGRLGRAMRALHRDEQGADMVEYILIIAAIALPVLGVLIYYRSEIYDWIAESWSDIRSGEGTAPD